MAVKFENHTEKVKGRLNNLVISALYESAGIIQAQAQRNSRVDTGQLRSSWEYKVDEDEGVATIGSPLENAIWEEYGTGQYALNGDGRKSAWYYEDAKGEGHFTHGKTPNRTLHRAFESKKGSVKTRIEKALKGLG